MLQRRQRVQIRGSYAPWITISTGVPQGSVLGPLLFNIYLSDLPSSLFVSNNSYADDFKIFGPAIDHFLQAALNQVFSWANRNGLILNPDKCTVLHFGFNNPNFNYYIGSKILATNSAHRDLGIIVDNKLTFGQHVDFIINKATRTAHYILKKFTHLDTSYFSLLYKTFIRPILEYCSQICRPFHSTLFHKLECCQRRLTKWCNSIRHLTYEERLQRLKLTTLQGRFNRGDVILTFQILKGLFNINSTDFFVYNFSRTRGHSLKIQGSTAKLNCRQHFFTERVVSLWNSLPENVISAPSLNSFKSRFDAWMR